MHWKGLLGAEPVAAITSVLGLVVMLQEAKGKSLEEIERDAATPVEKMAM